MVSPLCLYGQCCDDGFLSDLAFLCLSHATVMIDDRRVSVIGFPAKRPSFSSPSLPPPPPPSSPKAARGSNGGQHHNYNHNHNQQQQAHRRVGRV